MNKKILAISLSILIVIIAAVSYLVVSSNKDDDQQQSVNSSDSEKNVTPTENTEFTPESPEPGNYVDYDSEIIAQTPGTKLLFFHASWCPQCRALEDDIIQNGAPNGVTIIKVDYDNSQELRQKYGVVQQTTLVKVDDSGKEVAKYVAYDSPNLKSVAEKLL